MGILDIFRVGKVVAGTVKAVREQRSLAHELAALPMPQFVAECVRNLNQSGGNWTGRARPPDPAAATLVRQKQLPEELAEFYLHCDGFEPVIGAFPAALHPVAELRLGADCQPALSARLAAFWSENGNDSEQPGMLAVLPPDNLLALATNSAETYIRPSVVDVAVPLCAPAAEDFVVVLLASAGEHLPRGTVLEVEGGAATRYPGFKAWLGSRASLFGSLANRFGS